MTLIPVNATLVHISSGATSSPTISATGGNMLIVAGASQGGGLTVTRGTDTYLYDAQGTFAAQYHSAIASAVGVQDGAVSMTITDTFASGFTYWVIEVANVPLGDVLDANGFRGVVGGSGATATSTSLKNISVDAMFIAVLNSASASNPATVAITSAGWSSIVNGVDMSFTDGSAGQQVAGVAYKVASTAGTTEAAVWSVSTATWSSAIACYHGFGVLRPAGRGLG